MSLSSIEKQNRKLTLKNSRQMQSYKVLSGFIMGAWIAPFMLAGSMFVPLLGAVLTVVNILLTGYFLYINWSLALTLSWFFGAVVSVVFMIIVFSAFFAEAHVAGYFMIALSTFFLLCYLVKISALIVSRIERASVYSSL